MACEKCGYKDSKEVKLKDYYLCQVCLKFSPEDKDYLEDYFEDFLDDVFEEAAAYYSDGEDQVIEKSEEHSKDELGKLRNLFENASGPKESSMNKSVVNLLERRLDNVVFRLSFAPSRIAARQRVSHGHFLVNDKRASTPSYILKAGDVISLNPASRELLIFKDLPNIIKKYEPPQWLSLDKDKLEGKVKSLSFEVEAPFDVNLVVDYYSR